MVKNSLEMRNDIIIIIPSFNEKLIYKCLYLFFNINPITNTHLTNIQDTSQTRKI